jgi:hypothetical protein
MGLEITAKLVKIMDEVTGEGKNGTWRKQEFVVESGDQYPKKICMNVWGDRIEMLKGFAVGDTMKVSFDIESRDYQGRWYTDVKAWRIEGATEGQPSQESTPQKSSNQPKTADPFPEEMLSSSADDLPF